MKRVFALTDGCRKRPMPRQRTKIRLATKSQKASRRRPLSESRYLARAISPSHPSKILINWKRALPTRNPVYSPRTKNTKATGASAKINIVQALGVIGSLRRSRVITREMGRFKSFATIPSCDLPMWRRRCFSLATISLGCARKRQSSSPARVTLRHLLSNCSKSRGHALVRSKIGCSIFTGGVVEKNFDKAFRAMNKRVARMRASGSIEPKASVTRTRDSLVLWQPSLRKRNLGLPENDNLNHVCRSHCFGEFIEP